MKFRNYCVVIMGDTENVLPEIERVSDSKVNVLNAKGILIATFSSNFEPSELSEWFKDNGRSFLVFDLNKENSGHFITKKDVNEGLFGFLNDVDLEEKARTLLDTIEDAKVVSTVKKERKVKELTIADVEKMSKTEKQEMFDKILDKGADNFTENDKKIMPFLVK
jgi:nitrogen regulatory protein PII-like uncharacterized protein